MRAQLLATAVAVVLSGCASPSADPLEPINRPIFAANNAVVRHVVDPVATVYRDNVPDVVQTGIANFLDNLDEPITFGSQIIELRFKSAGETVLRTGANTIFGLGGTIKVSTSFGLADDPQDCGLALGSHGVPQGPYLVVPLMSPMTSRDAVGKVCGYFMDPLTYAHWNGENAVKDTRLGLEIVTAAARTVDTREDVERSSIDYYATVRSAVQQHRQAQVDELTGEHTDSNK